MLFYVKLRLCKSWYSYVYKIPKLTVYSYFYPGTEKSGIIPKFVQVNLKIIDKCNLYESPHFPPTINHFNSIIKTSIAVVDAKDPLPSLQANILITKLSSGTYRLKSEIEMYLQNMKGKTLITEKSKK
jgi:hypothetical protein